MKTRSLIQACAFCLMASMLASCGGGDGGGSGATASAPAGGAPTTPAPSPASSPPPPTSTADAGSWNNPATWGGTLPPDGAIVEIPAGKTVTLSGDTAKLGGLTIRGTLQFADADAQLTANWIAVHGALIAGSSTQPYTKKGVITLTGTDKKQDLFGMGTKGIMVMAGGTLQLHGEPRAGWSQLAATVQPGASSITLKDDMSAQWRAGDQLVIAPSSFEAEEYEVVTVTSVAGKTIYFTPALKYAHWGELQTFEGKTLDQRAAVGLLTRNLVVRGGDDSDAINFGGHTMIMFGAKAQVTGVEFFKMGQRGLPGRYPLHWHLAGDRQGDFAKNNTVRNSFQRAMVLHGTDNLLLEGNVAFDITNHAFVWAEDGNEKGNRLIKNLAVFNKNPKESEFAFPVNNNLLGNSKQSEFRSGSFWGRGFSHTIIGNIAAGSVDGFGFFFDRFSADIVGDNEGSGLVFEDNIAHSNYRPGAGGVAAEIYPEATFGHGLMTTTSLQSKTEHVFKRFTGYKNYGGAWMEDRVTRLQDSILADNGTGAYIHRGKLDGVVIVGKSANTLGNAEFPPKGGFGSGAKGAIVVPSSHGGARAPQLLDVTVVNHDDAAYVVDVDDLGYGAKVDKLKLVNVKSRAFFHEVNPYEHDNTSHGIDDVQGALTGDGKPTVWIKRRSAAVSSACRSDASVNAYACPAESLLLLRYKNAPSRWTHLIQPNGAVLILGQPWYFDTLLWDAQSINSGWVSNGGQYEVQWADAKGSAEIELFLEQSQGKSLELAWKVSGPATAITQNGTVIAGAGSLAQMRAAALSTQFYDAAAGKLHVKLVGAAGVQNIKLAAPFAPSGAAGRAADAAPALTSGIQANLYANASSTLRQTLPAGSPTVSTLNLSTLVGTNMASVLGSGINTSTVFRGYIEAPADGIYTLSVPTVGGNMDVFVGDAWVTGSSGNRWSVVNTPAADSKEENGLIALRKGVHPITVVFGRDQRQSGYDNRQFWLRWAAPGSNTFSYTPVYRPQ